MTSLATAEINGTTLYYTLSGHGPTCLVMHGGLGMDHVSCRELDHLGEHLQLVYYDHRGNGKSDRPPVETMTMEQLADDAAALAAGLTSQKFVVFGHSYGGFIAQEFVLRHPDRVSALILCDTAPGQLGANETEEQASGPPPPPEFLEMVGNPPETDEALAAGFLGLAGSMVHGGDPAVVDRIFRQTTFSVSAMKRGFEILGGWSAVDRLPSIEVPTLVLVGSHDVYTSPSQSRRIARQMPHAELVEFADSGHLPWLDEPQRFFSVVEDWLERALS